MHGNINNQERAVAQASPLTSAKNSSGAIIVATTFKRRDQWSRELPRVSGLTVTQRDVLRSLALCTRLDHNTKIVIDPTYAELTKAAGCHKATAIRAVEAGEQAGVLRKARHSDGRVSNVYELLLLPANPAKNIAKAPEKTVEIQCPTVAGPSEKTQQLQCPTVAVFADAAGSNGRTAATVLKVESKEVINTVYEEAVCVDNCTSDDATIPSTPMQRAEALHETVATQHQTPSATSIGAPPNGVHAGPGFAALCRNARQVFGAKGDAVAARLLTALGNDVDDALDTLAGAADETDPMAFLKMEVERTRSVTRSASASESRTALTVFATAKSPKLAVCVDQAATRR